MQKVLAVWLTDEECLQRVSEGPVSACQAALPGQALTKQTAGIQIPVSKDMPLCRRWSLTVEKVVRKEQRAQGLRRRAPPADDAELCLLKSQLGLRSADFPGSTINHNKRQ